MAELSEEDRKAILGREWKPFVETQKEVSGRKRTVALFVAVVLTATGLLVFDVVRKSQMATKNSPPALTKASGASPSTTTTK